MKLYLISRYKLQSLEIPGSDAELVLDELVDIGRSLDSIVVDTLEACDRVKWPVKNIYEIEIKRVLK